MMLPRKIILYLQYMFIISILLSGGLFFGQLIAGALDDGNNEGTMQQEDSDGDGWCDEDEILAGTDPHSADSDGDGFDDPVDPNPLVPQATTPPMTSPPPTTTPAPTTPPTTTPAPSPEKVIEVYHFHGTHQCTSCVLADEYAWFTIYVYLQEEYDSGLVTYGSYNYEDDENWDLVNWLNVYGSSVFVVERWEDGTTEIYNPTNKLWMLVWDKDQFVNYFKDYLEEKLWQSDS